MDFLDPFHRRRTRRRLIATYILFAGLLAAIVTILVYATSGYGFNTKTHHIVQNGLVFVESRPGGAEVSLNGTDKKTKTSARLVLPTGSYTLGLSKTGYRDWQRSFALREQAVLRLNYSLLIPQQLKTKNIAKYSRMPSLLSSSPDRHRLLVGGSLDTKGRGQVDVYDLQKPTAKPKSLLIPAKLLASRSGSGSLSAVEWADDNRHILLKFSEGKYYSFVVLNTQNVNDSVNVNQTFKVSPTRVNFRDKRANELYLWTARRGNLQVGVVGSRELGQPFLKGVQNYSSLKPGQIIYDRLSGKQLNIYIWQNGQSYLLSKLPSSTQPLLAGAYYRGHRYYAIGYPRSQWLTIYRDPLIDLAKPSPGKIDALESLKIKGMNWLEFSPDSRFVAASNGSHAISFDLNESSSYQFEAKAQAIDWADNFHLSKLDAGRAGLMDFDGSNQYNLLKSQSRGFISADYHQVWNLSTSKGSYIIQASSLTANPR